MRKIICLIVGIFFLSNLFSQITPASPVICGNNPVLLNSNKTSTSLQWIQSTISADGPWTVVGGNSKNYSASAIGWYKFIDNTKTPPDTSAAVQVTQSENPVAGFSFSPNNQCGNLPVSFTNSSTGNGLSYFWEFGDGTSATTKDASHNYSPIGNGTQNFSVTLTVTNSFGCVSVASQTVIVTQVPDASIFDSQNKKQFTNCTNSQTFNLIIDNISSTIGANTNYNIDWGDGSVAYSSTLLPNGTAHTYNSLGYFNLVLTVTNSKGCISKKTYSVYNGSNPQVPFSNPGSSIGECIPFSFSIPSLPNSNPPGTIYMISKNDGTSIETISALPAGYTYNHLFNKSSCGASGGKTPNTFYITIRAENQCGFSDLTVEPITTNIKPQANFSISPKTEICVNTNVTLSNTSIAGIEVDNYGTCDKTTQQNWLISPTTGWNVLSGKLGDATPSINPNTWGSSPLIVSFSVAGTYSVSLIVRNICGNDTITKQICVTNKLTPAFTLDKTESCTPLVVTATNNTNLLTSCAPATSNWTVSYSPAFCGTSSGWSFTNSTNASSVSPSFSFTNSGIYTITLTVTNPCGTFTTSQKVNVKSPPKVSLPVFPNSCGSVTINPVANVSNCGTSTLGYLWTFDGTTTSTSATPTITFSTVGIHTISLAVTNECGATTETKNVIIDPVPFITVPENKMYCAGETSGSINFTTNGTSTTWTNSNTNIGLGASGLGNIPSFILQNSTANPITSTITVTSKLGNCTTQSVFTIIVNPTPAKPIVTTPVTYCQNASATPLSATATKGHTLLWYATASGGTGSVTAPIFTTNTVGTTSYYVSQSSTTTNCEGPRAEIKIIVNPIPAFITSYNAPSACSKSDGFITISGLQPISNYTINYLQNGSPIQINKISDAGGKIILNGLAAGTYSNIAVTLNGCKSNEAAPITLEEPSAPNSPTISANGPLCSGQTLNLTSGTTTPGTATYSWTGPNGFSNSIQNPSITNVAMAASGTYYVTATIANCKSIAASIVVVVNPTPQITVNSNSPICTGSTLNLTSKTTFVGEITYSWTGPNSFANAGQNPSISEVALVDAGTFSLVATSKEGCVSPKATIGVVINQTPAILGVFASPKSCGSASGFITLTGLKPNSNYIVFSKKNGVNKNENITSETTGELILKGLTAGTYELISVQINGCNSNSVGPFILVDPTPPETPIATNDGAVCSGTTLKLFSTAAFAGATYNWSGPNGFTSNLQNPEILNVKMAANGIYILSVTLNSCTSASASTTVIIDSTPAIPSIGSNTPVCTENILNLTSKTTFPGAVTYSWTGPNGFIRTDQNPSIPNVSLANTGTYDLILTSNEGCVSQKASLKVDITPTPKIADALGTSPANCAASNGFITLTGLDANTIYRVIYTQNNINKEVSLKTDATGSVIISNLPAGIYDKISVILKDCASNTMGPITLSDPNPPLPPTIGSNSPLCYGGDLDLNSSTTEVGAISYLWTGPNGFSSSLQNPVITSVSELNVGTYFVKITKNSCASIETSLKVVINPLASTPIVTSPINYCLDQTAVPLNATASAENILNWYSVSNGGISSLTAPTPLTNSPGVVSYFVSQTTQFGCEGARSKIDVIVNPDAKAFFSPTQTINCPPFKITSSTMGLQTFPANNSSYDWYANGVFIGSGINFPGYTILKENNSVEIKLVTTSLFGCKSDSMSTKFSTYNLPHPAFTTSDKEGCGPLTVQFQNTTPNISSFTYLWDFGNGQTSTSAQPDPVIFVSNSSTFTDTIYTVKLKVFSLCDTLIFSENVTVKSRPKALFTPSKTTGCSPMKVLFKNTSKGLNNTYHWDFGDGSTFVTNSIDTFTHVFITGTVNTFYIKLKVVNECGEDEITYAIVASPNNIKLNFAMNGSDHFGCAPHTVAFINNSNGASSFQWNFGDGNTLSTTKNIDTVYHTYLTDGAFTVSLLAQNNCTDTSTADYITVYPKPISAFTVNNYSACIGETLQFNNKSEKATTYLWQFGDGYTSTQINPQHSYVTPGLYIVNLISYRTNPSGNICIDSVTHPVQIASTLPGFFDASDSIKSCTPFTVVFVNRTRPSVNSVWDFGDGNTATGDSVIHTFFKAGSFRVTLTVTVPGGCTYLSEKFIKVLGPSGSLQYSGGFVCYPNSVMLKANTSNTNTLIWDFGDGETVTTTSSTVYHNYLNPGVYVPSATLQNSGGCNVLLHGLDTIKVDKVNGGFSWKQEKFCGYSSLTFTDTSHVFFGNLLVKWNFGDGNSATGSTVNHAYHASGNYTIEMIIIGKSGCADTLRKQLNIQVNNKPIASIIGEPKGCVNQTFNFLSNIASSDAIKLIQWKLSNGVAGNGASFSYYFNTTGTYNLQLVTGTVNGCFDTAFHTIIINPKPDIKASGSITICLGNSAQLNATGASGYQWIPSQGLNCTSCPNPVATPTISTPYVVSTTNNFGCSAYDTLNITVIQPMKIDRSPDVNICIGQATNLLVSGGTSYLWTPAQGLSNTTISNPVASPIATTRYRVVGYDGHNCFTDTAFILIGVGKYPTVNLGPDLTLSTGTQHSLSSVIENGPIAQWLWQPSTNLDCATCPLPTATIRKDISYNVEVTSNYGCKAKDTINIKVFCLDSQVFIPNAFTPDGDGVNDILMVRGKGIVSVKYFRIFNRWGELVFEKNNFPPNDPGYGWNGKVRGVVGPPDVYVFTAEVVCENGSTYIYKGNTSIIK